MSNLTYLQGYPEQLLSQVRTLINEQRLGDVLAKRYPGTHDYATDKALWQYTQDLKNQFLRNAPPINKVMYDNKIHVLKNALGLHTAVSRVQGGVIEGFWRDTTPLLRPGKKSGVATDASCFPLVPFANRVSGNRFVWQGREYQLQPNVEWDAHYLHGDGWLGDLFRCREHRA